MMNLYMKSIDVYRNILVIYMQCYTTKNNIGMSYLFTCIVDVLQINDWCLIPHKEVINLSSFRTVSCQETLYTILEQT